METIIIDYVRAGRVVEVQFRRAGEGYVATAPKFNETFNAATNVVGYDAGGGKREFSAANVLYYGK